MAGRITRRLALVSGIAAARILAVASKGSSFPSAWKRYPDPATEFEVYRLTDPAYSSTMPAHYSRAIARNSGWMVFGSDREGTVQAFQMDLKNGSTKQLTDVADLDAASLTLTPDNRSICYFAGRKLCIAQLASLRQRELYEVPEGWDRCAGMAAGPDGTHATFAERRGDASRLRMVSLVQGVPRTVCESPFVMSEPIPRPMRAQVLYRRGDEALWLVNSDGTQNHQLKTADGRIGPANWSPDGHTVLYLNFPADTTQLNAIREITPDTNTEKLVAKTSQFVHFGFNRDGSVFVGSSRNKASPTVLLLLRITRRELTICEHKSSHPETVAPRFAPDSQRVYFESDRDGKPAIYGMHVERLVEKTDVDG